MSTLRVLVPYNFTAQDRKALSFVARTFSGRPNIEVHLFYAHPPAADLDPSGAPLSAQMESSRHQYSRAMEEHEESLKEAGKKLVELGLNTYQIHYIFKPRKKGLAPEIIDLVDARGFNVVVINRRPGKVSRFFTGNVFERVAAELRDVAIFLVT